MEKERKEIEKNWVKRAINLCGDHPLATSLVGVGVTIAMALLTNPSEDRYGWLHFWDRRTAGEIVQQNMGRLTLPADRLLAEEIKRQSIRDTAELIFNGTGCAGNKFDFAQNPRQPNVFFLGRVSCGGKMFTIEDRWLTLPKGGLVPRDGNGYATELVETNVVNGSKEIMTIVRIPGY